VPNQQQPTPENKPARKVCSRWLFMYATLDCPECGQRHVPADFEVSFHDSLGKAENGE
jgi:hypothetical protein